MGNPPHIDTRIEIANSQTNLTEQKISKAKISHQESLAQLNPVIEKINSLNNQLKKKIKIKTNTSNQLSALKQNLIQPLTLKKKANKILQTSKRKNQKSLNH